MTSPYFRVTLIVGLPPRLTSFWIISSQFSSNSPNFPLKFSISSQPGWQAGTIEVTLPLHINNSLLKKIHGRVVWWFKDFQSWQYAICWRGKLSSEVLFDASWIWVSRIEWGCMMYSPVIVRSHLLVKKTLQGKATKKLVWKKVPTPTGISYI